MQRGWVQIGYLGLVGAFGAQALEMPKSSVEAFKVESNMGPSEAILQPLFPKDNKVELGAGGAWSPYSSLVKYYSASGSLTYHINRRHAIEPIAYNYNFGDITGFVKSEIRDKESGSKNAALSVEVPRQSFAASYLFSPYYAKLHLSSRAVTHFDVYLGAGFGAVSTEQVFLNDAKGDKQWRPSAVATAGLRFLFQPRWSLRLEVRDFIHRSENFAKNSTVNTLQMGLTLGFFFGEFPSFD
jgi:outer membrane beta-barrel protein